MSFEDENELDGAKKPATFFGLELSDGVVYTVVVILTLIFIRQASIVVQAIS